VIVVDTHVWVWWLTKPEKLARKAARTIDKADRVGVCAISVWEVAMKAEMGKFRFGRPYDVWLEEALSDDPRIELLPPLPRIAVDAVQLSWSHGDPADRFIVATARIHEAVLVTADEKMHDAKLVRCVWD